MIDNGWLLPVLAVFMIIVCLVFVGLWILFRASVKELRQEIQSLRHPLRRDKIPWPNKRMLAHRVTVHRKGGEFAGPGSSEEGPASRPSKAKREILQDTHIAEEDVGKEEMTHLSEVEGKIPRRKVRVTKHLGRPDPIKLQTSFVGVEEMPPEAGKCYRVILEDGRVLRTSPVIRVSPRFIETRNSLYELDILEELEPEKRDSARAAE